MLQAPPAEGLRGGLQSSLRRGHQEDPPGELTPRGFAAAARVVPWIHADADAGERERNRKEPTRGGAEVEG